MGANPPRSISNRKKKVNNTWRTNKSTESWQTAASKQSDSLTQNVLLGWLWCSLLKKIHPKRADINGRDSERTRKRDSALRSITISTTPFAGGSGGGGRMRCCSKAISPAMAGSTRQRKEENGNTHVQQRSEFPVSALSSRTGHDKIWALQALSESAEIN